MRSRGGVCRRRWRGGRDGEGGRRSGFGRAYADEDGDVGDARRAKKARHSTSPSGSASPTPVPGGIFSPHPHRALTHSPSPRHLHPDRYLHSHSPHSPSISTISHPQIHHISKSKGKEKAREEGEAGGERVPEEKMPPKMRKRWIHQSAEVLKEAVARGGAEVVPSAERALSRSMEVDVVDADAESPPDIGCVGEESETAGMDVDLVPPLPPPPPRPEEIRDEARPAPQAPNPHIPHIPPLKPAVIPYFSPRANSMAISSLCSPSPSPLPVLYTPTPEPQAPPRPASPVPRTVSSPPPAPAPIAIPPVPAPAPITAPSSPLVPSSPYVHPILPVPLPISNAAPVPDAQFPMHIRPRTSSPLAASPSAVFAQMSLSSPVAPFPFPPRSASPNNAGMSMNGMNGMLRLKNTSPSPLSRGAGVLGKDRLKNASPSPLSQSLAAPDTAEPLPALGVRIQAQSQVQVQSQSHVQVQVQAQAQVQVQHNTTPPPPHPPSEWAVVVEQEEEEEASAPEQSGSPESPEENEENEEEAAAEVGVTSQSPSPVFDTASPENEVDSGEREHVEDGDGDDEENDGLVERDERGDGGDGEDVDDAMEGEGEVEQPPASPDDQDQATPPPIVQQEHSSPLVPLSPAEQRYSPSRSPTPSLPAESEQPTTEATPAKEATPPPPQPPPPPPPPPSKVKMSLKDFAMRKKKQREEEMARGVVDGCSAADTPGTGAEDAGSVSPVDAPANGMGKQGWSDGDGAKPNGEVEVIGATGKENVPADHLGPPKEEPLVNGNSRDEPMQVDTAPVQVHAIVPSPPVASWLDQIRSYTSKVTPGTDTVMADTPIPVSHFSSVLPTKLSQPEPPPSNTKPPPSNTKPAPDNIKTASDKLVSNRSHVHSPHRPMPVPVRQFSTEDGEIPTSASIATSKPSAFLPRAHTPPTQPRSFSMAVPSAPPAPTNRRPSHIIRQPPSGPRALRPGSMAPRVMPMGGIPRGPSADRERLDLERERGWPAAPRGRGWGAGSGAWVPGSSARGGR
ncbi:hypothetical protein FIBSPDRAFT_193430 [Athelia psychrophila]|uniref:Uncharacterized protein n=1 Tax=Athelia psychrophila TaxID=1759441 RepID=A0A166SI03_9AGAM|nr:hypothetical protein FIBSPDRAFT_193430 [Fibularhizoctonia sp. CBS 109695]